MWESGNRNPRTVVPAHGYDTTSSIWCSIHNQSHMIMKGSILLEPTHFRFGHTEVHFFIFVQDYELIYWYMPISYVCYINNFF